MIHEVDEALRRLVERELAGSGVEISFEAPNRDWAARRSTPTVDLYLYDIREDRRRRNSARESVRDDTGRVIAHRQPPRMFKLSYLVTAWTQRPEDEHRLLSSVLACVLGFDALPRDVLSGSLLEQSQSLPVSVGLPPTEDRALSEVWTALGGELKPSLDLMVTSPVDARRSQPAAPPVLEEPRLSLGGDAAPRRVRRPAEVAAEERPPPADEAIQAGTAAQPGRTVRVREVR